MRTQNPPPLKACRFDSDLGHHLNSRLICLAGVYARCRNRRIGLLMRFNLSALAEAVTHSLHIKSAADDLEVGARQRYQSRLQRSVIGFDDSLARSGTDFDPDQSLEVVQINVHPKAARNFHRLPMLGADDVAFDAV